MKENLPKLVRITTIPHSFILFKNQPRYMSAYYDVIGISSPGTDLENVAIDEGIRVYSVPMTRKISPLKDLRAVIQLYRILRKERPFIVHTHTPKAGIVGMLASFFARVPNRIHTVAGMPLLVARGGKRILLELVEKLTYLCATEIFPNSQGLADIIIESKFAKAEKIKVIANGSSNGINTSYFNLELVDKLEISRLKRDLNITEGDFVFIYIGRKVRDKGVEELVSAFAAVNKEIPNTKLILLGSYERDLDPISNAIEQEIDLNPNIINIDHQHDVRPYLAISHVLSFPSYREGFPNVVMQAGAMGLPALVSDINGCNEIIVEGKNGTIVPVKDIEAIKKSMFTLISEVDYFSYLKANARPMIIDRYEQKVVWDALLKEYKRLENYV